jgi:hypothetical protein
MRQIGLSGLTQVNIVVLRNLTIWTAGSHGVSSKGNGENGEAFMRQFRSLAKSFTFAGLALSAVLGIAGVTVSSEPAGAVVYCTYVGYPAGCVARAGVVLRPRPVARAAVRHNVGGNANGGVNRVGARR